MTRYYRIDKERRSLNFRDYIFDFHHFRHFTSRTLDELFNLSGSNNSGQARNLRASKIIGVFTKRRASQRNLPVSGPPIIVRQIKNRHLMAVIYWDFNLWRTCLHQLNTRKLSHQISQEEILMQNSAIYKWRL